MTQTKLLSLLESIGLPVTYHHFKNPPKPPYIVYLFLIQIILELIIKSIQKQTII